MKIEEVKYDLNGHTLIFRSAVKSDALELSAYLKKVCGESKYLTRYEDECPIYSLEDEEKFIESHLDNEKACLICAYLDGEYVGNSSFSPAGPSRRNLHMAEIGIALYQKYTGMGIGKKLFGLIIDTIKKCGYESACLEVISGNEIAIHMYESFGFIESGRKIKANKYDDGTYSDNILMYKEF